MANVFDTLKERGFIAQCTNEAELRELFDKERVTFYIGFDPTADSLHAGHFIALMAMAHMQRAGHRPICLVGGGTGTVGDPTGRTDMRKMLTDEDIEHNCECFKKQIARFIDFSDGKAIMVNNGDWLRKLNYIDLLRDVGACFTVNRMLAAECYKQRWEKGLTFLEFNYMVMQAYDFLELNRRYGCKLEMGGDDQWSNIIAGVELNRRKNNVAVYGLTNKLLTKSDGKKMGKTAGGALWLDAEKTSPYEFYQYWRNVDDADVEKCLALPADGRGPPPRQPRGLRHQRGQERARLRGHEDCPRRRRGQQGQEGRRGALRRCRQHGRHADNRRRDGQEAPRHPDGRQGLRLQERGPPPDPAERPLPQ